MDKPFISVVMSCFNSASTLERALKSILHQTYSKFEFIIVDDGSEDGTRDLLETWSKRDARVRIIQNEQNEGLSVSFE